MNLGKAFEWPFKDPNWGSKMVLFALFLLLSGFLIGIPFVAGYMVLAVKAAAKGEDKLPEWTNNYNEIFMIGIKYVVVLLVVGVIGGFISAFKIPALSMLWSLVNLAISPAILIKLANSKEFGEVFDFSWYSSFIGKNISNIIIVTLLEFVFGIIAGLGILGCVVGVFLTVFYAAMANAFLVGELWRVSGEPVLAGVAPQAPAAQTPVAPVAPVQPSPVAETPSTAVTEETK